MNTRLSLLLLCLVVLNTAWAVQINQYKAKSIADDFMSAQSSQVTSMKMAYQGPAVSHDTGGVDHAAYYVFNSNTGNDGFVIIAGDDRVPAILGYSDQGNFDADQVPEAMQEWLEGVAAQIAALDDGAQAATHLQARPPIQPLLHSTWSQNSPYYILLPFLPTGKHAVVGCAATAIAQVMYYWKWPAQPSKTIPAYVTDELSISMPSLQPVNFNWDAMQSTYLTSDTTSVASYAAATLSLYCAQSLKMDFRLTSSSASTASVMQALIEYFDYSPDLRSIARSIFTTQEWENTIYQELAAQRPVIYRGAKQNNGHMFVCDGYDGNGMFHINWGWNSSSNGYFLLSILNPDLQGTGSASGSFGYIYNQSAFINIKPGGSSQTSGITVAASKLELVNHTDTRSGANDNFSATLYANFSNYTPRPISFYYGFGLYSGDQLISVLYSNYFEQLNSWYYVYTTRSLTFGSGLNNGTYRIVPIYRLVNTSPWTPCEGAQVNYVEAVINGNTCSFYGHGMAATPDYHVNNVNVTGHMHINRPVDFALNLTNRGNSLNDLIYMFVDGIFEAAGQSVLGKGETGDVNFRYTPKTTGTHTVSFALNEDGTNALATRTVTISPIPAANLTGNARVLNVTDATNKVITSDKFSVKLTVTNRGTTTYDEDISINLYKHIYGNYGTAVQGMYQPIHLAPGASTVLQFDLDNVENGWKYFIKTFYYSTDGQISLAGSGTYTIIVPETPQYQHGDVNHDGEINIADLNAIINVILAYGGSQNVASADLNYDGSVDIADVNAMINILLNKG